MKRFTILLLAGLTLLACNKKKTEAPEKAIPVKVEAIADWNAATERHYVGQVESEHALSLRFELGGTLEEVCVKNGQLVKKGQLLARVDNTTAKALHETALASLRQAEDAYERLKKVHEGGGISDVRWVQMETDLEKARQAEITARKHLEDCSLYAPQDGLIAGADYEPGAELKPMETFAELMDLGHLRVAFSVPEQEINLIRIGKAATATIPALDGRKIELSVSDRSYVTNPLGHTYTIRATMAPGTARGELLPGMVAKVSMAATGHEGIVIPSGCIQTMADGLAVWTIRDGKAERRYITAKDFVENGVLVGEGLQTGDTIVTEGYQKLYSGAKVSVIE